MTAAPFYYGPSRFVIDVAGANDLLRNAQALDCRVEHGVAACNYHEVEISPLLRSDRERCQKIGHVLPRVESTIIDNIGPVPDVIWK
jgi:hypothetical protein